MKFLCDRCQTRYSIGDDRVRGKILRIRCKNCANVITVREGMVADAEPSLPAPPAPPAPIGRANQPTMAAPAALDEASDPAKAETDPSEDLARGDRSQPAAPPGSALPYAEGPPGEEAPYGAGSPRGDRAGSAGPGPRGPGAPAASAREPMRAAKDRAGFGAGQQRAPSGGAGPGPLGAGRRGGGVDAPRGEPVNTPVNTLNAAFASAMAKPPPALEEEWYVSINGDQAGPFSLSEAQGWVAQQPPRAELHCWSEGFDDWLPVDKVSHFRGRRKRPAAPTAPPPLPRGAGAPQRAAPVAPVLVPTDDEPKPLFAATMASLERGAPVAHGPGASLPSPATPSARATPPRGVPPRIHPAGKPANGARDAGREPGAVGDAGQDAQSIQDTRSTQPTNIAPVRPADPATTTAASTAAAADLGGDGDELAIGEVSRVVKLADIGGTPRPLERPGAARRAGTAGGSVGRLTGQNPVVRSTASIAAMQGTTLDGSPAAPDDADPAMTMAPIRTSHRRGLIALLGVASVMVLGVVGAVILLVTTNDDPTGGSLGPVRGIDTSRPEDPITHRPVGPVVPSTPPPAPSVPRPTPHSSRPNPTPAVGSNHHPELPPGNSLRSDEIEDVARKHHDMTQRCYMRSQRGADAILIGDVKKIAVTLLIDQDGIVREVQLSDHAADNLGKCLSGSIRGWKFRPSSGGTFRFSLNFVGG